MVKKIALIMSVLLFPVMVQAAPPWTDGGKKNSDWKADKQQQKYEKKRAHEEAKKNRKYEHEEYKKDFRSDREDWKNQRSSDREEWHKDRDRDDRDYREDRYRKDRYDRDDYDSGTSTDEVMDTAIDSVMPEDMKDSPASDVIKQEAKKWWER